MRRGLHALLALAALGWLVAMVVVGQLPRQAQFVAFEADGVMSEAPTAVRKVTLSAGTRQVTFSRPALGLAREVDGSALHATAAPTQPAPSGTPQHNDVVETVARPPPPLDGWTHAGRPLPSAAAARLNLATQFLHTARPVRVLNAAEVAGTSAAEFGLREDSLKVTVRLAGGREITLQWGGPTLDGSLQYLRLAGSDVVYLMSGFVGDAWAGVWSDWHP